MGKGDGPKKAKTPRTEPAVKKQFKKKEKLYPGRTAATAKRLKMYTKRAKHDAKGRFISGDLMSRDTSHQAVIFADRNLFSNQRVIGQAELDRFRTEVAAQVHDPYTVLLKQQKLPLSLLNDPMKKARSSVTHVEPFDQTFGPKKQRKRVKMSSVTEEELATASLTASDAHDPENDSNVLHELEVRDEMRHPDFEKGQSKRIWGETYKVIDSSDVVCQVIDARDPMGTRCSHIEKYMKKHCAHKHVVLVLNKSDLVPTWVTARWISLLSKEYPTLAFHASQTNPFGKGSLINLLRQFAKLHQDKKNISVGFIGYPNVGKSSIINTLRSKAVCKVAPIPGETKVWQYITLFRRVFLIDCPGVVYPSGESDTDIVLKGVLRIENLPHASDYVETILERVKTQYIQRVYGLTSWVDHEDFLTQLARKGGRLLKGGEPDLNGVAKKVLYDWQRGRLPYFVAPPVIYERKEDVGAPLPVTVELPVQKLSEIDVEHRFEEDEAAPDAAATPADDSAAPADAAPAEHFDDDEASDDVDWDQVFNADADADDGEPKKKSVPKPIKKQPTAAASKANADNEDSTPKKGKSGKQYIGNRFYDRVDVKNRNKRTRKPADDADAKSNKPKRTRSGPKKPKSERIMVKKSKDYA
eukprot:TRINITY_DN5211_c0_g1_i1.p1 TRINITY_DN5211_c0_g1~~TRINITY_DN5211_c0_g1_i1.p1  ORF type:complete len:641 (-),score=170.35 TRINITY_DN5211_c0_g1_i1:174-2096(-)